MMQIDGLFVHESDLAIDDGHVHRNILDLVGCCIQNNYQLT